MDLMQLKNKVTKMADKALGTHPMEAKVRDCTNDDPWGPHGSDMQEVAEGTFSYESKRIILDALYRRLQPTEPKKWRNVYKALLLLEHLIKNGAELAVEDFKDNQCYVNALLDFHYKEDGKDHGISVRERATKILALLNDPGQLQEERRKAQETRNKVTGFSNERKYDSYSSQDRRAPAPSYSSGQSQYRERTPPATKPTYTPPVREPAPKPVSPVVTTTAKPKPAASKPAPVVQQPKPAPQAAPPANTAAAKAAAHILEDDIFGTFQAPPPPPPVEEDLFAGATFQAPSPPPQAPMPTQQQQHQEEEDFFGSRAPAPAKPSGFANFDAFDGNTAGRVEPQQQVLSSSSSPLSEEPKKNNVEDMMSNQFDMFSLGGGAAKPQPAWKPQQNATPPAKPAAPMSLKQQMAMKQQQQQQQAPQQQQQQQWPQQGGGGWPQQQGGFQQQQANPFGAW